MDKKMKIYQVDAFTGQPFKGNPAGVMITQSPLSDSLMQSIALEMNLSETAFAVPIDNQDIKTSSEFNLRWFTPLQEVNLCGHATLATAKVLFDVIKVKSKRIVFKTKSGDLIVTKKNGFCLDFPADSTQQVTCPTGLLDALGIKEIKECAQSQRMKKLLVCLIDFNSVIGLKPDFGRLYELERSYGNRGFIVTAKHTDEFDFVSRFFAPGVGINEDPVTGSAHTVLGPYWGKILNKDSMKAYQASSRGGVINVEIHGDRVYLTGEAVLVIKGELNL